MSDAGDEVKVEAVDEPVVSEAPKGKMGVEDALQVCFSHLITSPNL